MKRAAIIVLAIATLVLIVLPSAYPLASTPVKSRTYGPSVITTYSKPANIGGPSTTTPGGGGGGGGGGTDQGDADGLSGLKVKPGTTTNSFGIGTTTGRIAITLMMWWRYMVLIR